MKRSGSQNNRGTSGECNHTESRSQRRYVDNHEFMTRYDRAMKESVEPVITVSCSRTSWPWKALCACDQPSKVSFLMTSFTH